MENPDYRSRIEEGIEDTKRYITAENPNSRWLDISRNKQTTIDVYAEPEAIRVLNRGGRIILARASIPFH